MKLSQCILPLLNYNQQGEGNPEINHIEIDSRKVVPGALFVCIQGQQFDSHKFAQSAVENGAVAIVAEKPIQVDVPVIYVSDTRRILAVIADTFFNHPTHHLHLIGVTGTNGKTTVTHIIQELFEYHQQPTGVIGTIGIKYNNRTLPVDNTTPESLVLQQEFRNMVNEGVTRAVIEVSSHALHQGRVRGCDFNIAVFTNLTQDHLDYHPTMKDYLYAKSLLFSQLGNTYGNNDLKVAIFNNDEKASEELKKVTAAQVLTYGIDHDADFKANNIKVTSQGTHFSLTTPIGVFDVRMKLIGKFSVYNTLSALAVGFVSGLNVNRMVKALETITGIPGRFETVEEGQDFAVVVDYSHTPDSLEKALTTIQEFSKGDIITVVGCGGDRDRTKRPLMAKVSVNHSDMAIFTSDNPRTEDPDGIIKDMEAGVPEGSYTKLVDRREAIYFAIQQAKPNDVILIAGKGHETYQIIGKNKSHFDDREVAADAIKERKL